MRSVRNLVFNSEEHKPGNFLRDVILGGQDGLVNVLGIVLGINAAGGDTAILIAAALAATFAEAVSMGAVAYTSTLSAKDHYQKELQRERDEVEKFPDREVQEIKEIYAAKGFSGSLLDDIVAKITESKDVWVNTMMKEELGLELVNGKDILKSSIIVGVATVVGSLLPVVPFFFFPEKTAILACLFLSTAVLFTVGVYKAKTYVGDPLKSGLQMAAIGLGAAVIGFLVGKLFRVN